MNIGAREQDGKRAYYVRKNRQLKMQNASTNGIRRLGLSGKIGSAKVVTKANHLIKMLLFWVQANQTKRRSFLMSFIVYYTC